MATIKLIFVAFVALTVSSATSDERPAYVRPCKAKDPKLAQCVIESILHLRPYLSTGIPAIQMPTIEPFRLDELSLALTSGPQGYKITLKDMDIFGVSNFTISKIKLSKNGSPFEAHIRMPLLTMTSDYKSSGVLLILPASGSGNFHCTMKDVMAIMRGTVKFYKGGKEHMKVDSMTLELDVKSIKMHIEKAFQNNPILREATNLFLRENGLEVFGAMKTQLNGKLASQFQGIANTMLKNTPSDLFFIED